MIDRRHVLSAALALPAAVVFPALARAATPPVYAEGGIAIDGTDAVSYFAEGRPAPGLPEYAHVWNGATWHFRSAAHRDRFAAEPEVFAPQFGGYCAWAVAEGYTAATIPDAWKIVDRRLYLNFSRRVQRRWERDVTGNIARGNANWPGVLG